MKWCSDLWQIKDKVRASLTLYLEKNSVNIKRIWANLNLPQRFFFTALIALALDSIWLCGVLTTVALIIEFWPKFIKVWDSIEGKACILIFYAIIANFVLASASGIVNEVTQVSAEHFNYTHNFAILLYLPVWMLSISLAILLLLQLLLPAYILLLLLKPFGAHQLKFVSQCYSPVTTAITRFLLSWVVITALADFVEDSQFSNFAIEVTQGIFVIDDPQQVLPELEKKEIEPKAVIKHDKSEKQALVEVTSEVDKQALPLVSGKGDELDIQLTPAASSFINTKGYYERSKRLIALFAYSLEANSFSRCTKKPNSKVVELNDYELVEITPNKDADYGYSFEVKVCKSAAF
jgi:hypothetical protein